MYSPIEQHLTSVFEQQPKESLRIFHGRGHLYEGLEHINIDWYPPVLLITGYQKIDSLDLIIAAAKAHDKSDQIETILYQERSRNDAPSKCVWGKEVEKIIVEENGIKFEVQPGVRQNAGLFLDMRPLRRWLKEGSKGKNVLNLFSYTCSLSVAALAGNARQVVSVDMSKPSIKWGERNHQLNNHDKRAIRSIPHNILKSWGRIEKYGPYDTVIIDPPTRQVGSFDAERDYIKVVKRLSRLCNPSADVIATLNSPYLGLEHLPHLMQRYQSQFRLLGNFPVSPEFKDKYPERALKIHHFKSPN